MIDEGFFIFPAMVGALTMSLAVAQPIGILVHALVILTGGAG